MVDKVKQGKKNKRSGADFERRVRENLELKGWIVSRWGNNVEFIKQKEKDLTGYEHQVYDITGKEVKIGKLVPAKPGRFRMMQTGFPDFIAYILQKKVLKSKFEEGEYGEQLVYKHYEIIFVECKTNGYLDKEEKEKALFYLNNNYCSKFLIASKFKEKGKIKVSYKEV